MKSSANTDRGFMNKLKGFDGLAMSIGNGNTESAEAGSDHGSSQRFVDYSVMQLCYLNLQRNKHY